MAAIRHNDVVMFVSDNDELFEVAAYRLRTHSSVFRDMLDSKSFNSESEPISIAADGDVVDRWIDFLKNEPVADLSLAHIESLLKLCETFKMDTLAAAIYPQLLRYVRSASTEVFCIAAKFDNHHLARIAAMEMFRAYYAQSEVLCRDKVTSFFKSEPMASCPRNYVLELHLAAFFCGFTQTKSGLWGIDREEWQRQIDNFDPQSETCTYTPLTTVAST